MDTSKAEIGSSATMNFGSTAKARAILHGRFAVTADDIRRVAFPVLRHRIFTNFNADAEGVDAEYAQIVDAHFFRGRLWAREAEARQQLYAERVFDDILMAEGVVTHYLPIPQKSVKGIDVWLALEAFELSFHLGYR